MNDNNEWWTAPAESEDGRLVMVSGRENVKKFRDNPKFNIRVEITWTYDESSSAGMPSEETSRLMEQVQDALDGEFRKDPVAVMTGIYTGAGERNWIFYTLSTNIFGRKVNEVLAPFPLLPLKIYTENDPDWAEYDEMTRLKLESNA
ncbi:MAG: DUF695 domain-containing protein [Lachnoclostridium sp.]|nr:DUF695 domain-containing protein [Lachnoclostridium sp.]